MAASSVVKNLNDGTITAEDGTTPSAVSLDVDFDQGDFSCSGLAQKLNEVTAYESRGTLKSLRHTSRTYPSGSFTLMLTDLSDGTDQTLVDFLRKTGSYSGNVSTRGANADVYTVNLTLSIEGTDFGDAADHTIVLNDCHCTVDVSEGDPNTITVNFICYGSVTLT